MDGIADGAGVCDGGREFEELCGVDDRIWDSGFLDQFFLEQFSAEIAHALQPVGADD